MSVVASVLIRMLGRRAASRFEASTKNPRAAQQDKLLQMMRRNKDTDYGRRYGFGSIRSLDDYRRQVPPVSYDDIDGEIKKILAGKEKVLTAEKPLMFAQTSGTTGEAKYIPVTATCRGRDHADTMRTWLYHAISKHPGMFRGQVISMVSPAVEGYTEAGIPYGSASGHIYKNMPRPVQSTYAIPYSVFLIQDYDAKYYTIMRFSLAANVTFVGTANPSSILKMCEYASEHADDLIQDLAKGTLRQDLDIDPEIRSTVEACLKADPGRARLLERARGIRSGKLLPADYWPNLALLGCWKGGTVGTTVKKLSGWFDPDGRRMVPVRDWGYLSSEARGSIPLSDHGSAGALTVNANFFEFVPVDSLEDHPHETDRWQLLGVEDLEIGGEYYVFLTTTGGLYRYDINDVIEVVGNYNSTPTIVFKRKGRGMSSITGEKLSVNQVIVAMESSSRKIGVSIDHFKVEPDVENARYIFKVEASKLETTQRHALLREIEAGLVRLNIEYEAKRKSGRLNDPVLQVMKQGWYERQKKALVASGKRLFQAKTVLLDAKAGYSPDPENLEAEVTLQDE